MEKRASMTKRAKYFKNVTITMTDKDIADIEDYIKKQKELIDVDSPISKSRVIRKALRVLYKINKPFDQIA